MYELKHGEEWIYSIGKQHEQETKQDQNTIIQMIKVIIIIISGKGPFHYYL